MEKFILTFAGQGSPWHPVADDALEEALELTAGLDLPPLDLTRPTRRPSHSVPGILLTQLRALDNLQEPEPAGYMGHSQGALAATAAAGEVTRVQAVALARLIGAAIESVATTEGLAANRDGVPMRAVLGATRAEVEDALVDGAVIALVNSRDEFIISGAPAALNRTEQRLSAKVQALDIDAAFHHPAMRRAVEMVEEWSAGIGLADKTTTRRLAQAVLTDRIEWPAMLQEKVQETGTQWVVDLGPGTHLNALNEKALAGRGIGTRMAGDTATKRPAPWSDYMPHVERGRVVSRMTEATGYPPILLAGMTPGTVDPGIVAAAANAGYWAELAGGGLYSLRALRESLETLHRDLAPGVSAQFNTLYMDAKRWRDQIEGSESIIYQREAGAPINGVVVSAGIPPHEEAVELVQRLYDAAIPWVAFKPGTAQHVAAVLALADALPNHTILLQLEGGQAGGHHSWQGLEDTLAATYADIRARDNVVVVVGGGIGTPERAADFFTGEWALPLGLPPAPVDGVLIGTAAMTAREATATDAVKQALVDTPGTAEWLAPGTAAGGISAGRSQYDADLYELDNAWGKAGRLVDWLDEGDIDKRRAEIIAALEPTAKPYFGDVEKMTYQQWLERYLELSYPWADSSWATRFTALVQRTEARLVEVDSGEFDPRVTSHDDPYRTLRELVDTYPAAEELMVHPADRHWFVRLLRGSGKPPAFVPVIDKDVRRWWRRDSFWQANDPRYTADQVCAIPGPVAVAGINTVNEPVAAILRRFEDAAADRLPEKTADRSPEEVLRVSPVIDWAGRQRVNELAQTTDIPARVDTSLPNPRPPQVTAEDAAAAQRERARQSAGGWLPDVTDGVAEYRTEFGPPAIARHAAAVGHADTQVLADALVGLTWPAIYAVLADRQDVVVELDELLHAEHHIEAAALDKYRRESSGVTVRAEIEKIASSARHRRLVVQVVVRGDKELARLTETFVLPPRMEDFAAQETFVDAPARQRKASAGPGPKVKKPRSFLGRETIQAPRNMREFAAATGDYNPLHLAGEGALVHGMWTSVAVQSVVTVHTGAVVDWRAEMVAPVRPSDELVVTVERIGVGRRGAPVVQATATVAGEPVLQATATCAVPVTFYAFPGQGIQCQGMGMDAYGASASARAIWDRADRHTRKHLGFSVLHIVRANPRRVRVKGEDFTHPEGVVNLTQFTQVSMAVLAYAQVAQLKEEGVLDGAAFFAGHSVGEYTALAAYAGVLSLEAVIDVVYRRGLTMHRLVERDAEGNSAYAMAALRPHKMAHPPADVAGFVDRVARDSGEFLEIANYNVAGRQYAIAGTRAGIAALEEAGGAVVRIPGLDVPFHSSRLRGGVDDFRAHLNELVPFDVHPERLIGRYIPNLVARPFQLDDEFLAAVADVVDSPVIDRLRAELAAGIADQNAFARMLLIELLAWQFASPVRWIETQSLILGGLGIERFVEVGVAHAPTLANMLGQTMATQGIPADALDVFNAERDAARVFATDVRAAPAEEQTQPGPETQPEHEPAPKQTPAAPATSRPADRALTPEVALTTLLAVWTKARPDQIAATDTIETLVDGVSSRRNQMLLDVWSEFSIGAIGGAADMPVPELAAAIAKEAPSYAAFGPVLRQAVSAALSKVVGPAGKKPGYIAERVQGTWQLGAGWVHRVQAELATETRAGESMRGGALGSLADYADVDALIDAAVLAAGRRAGVDIPRPVNDKPAAGVEKRALDDVAASLTQAFDAAARAGADALRESFDIDEPPVDDAPDDRAEEAEASITDAVRRELGPNWIEQVAPIFGAEKVVIFDDRWASAREDLIRGDSGEGEFTALGEDVARIADYLGCGDAAAAARQAASDLPFDGRTVVVTGASPDSIAAAIVAELLRGGARVVATTSRLDGGRLPTQRREFYRELYRTHAAGRARLDVVPVNLAAFADIDAFTEWLGAADIVPWALFPFAAPQVAGTLADAGSTSEAQMRVLLWSVERLIARLADVGADTCVGERLHVVLPGSPNRGLFGGDGAYGEAKVAFDALVARWSAETDWSARVALAHAHIGWVRGTGLMRGNDDLVDKAQKAGISVWWPRGIAKRVVRYLADPGNQERMAESPQTLDLTGGLAKSRVSLRELRAQVDQEPVDTAETPPRPRALPNIDKRVPAATPQAAKAFSGVTQKLSDMVVMVGGAELGPCGTSRTRWQVETTGTLSAAGVIELAWQMGLIHCEDGWVTADGDEIAEENIAERYRDEVLGRIGVRRFNDGFGTAAPMVDNLAPGLATVYLDHDVTFDVADEASAHEFAAEDPRVRITQTDTGWQVTRPRGTAVRVPKRVTMSRLVGGQIPDGFDPGVYGVPREMQDNLDRAAVWNLVCTVDAFVSAGFTPGELLGAVHPARVASTHGTGMGGVESVRALYINGLLGEPRQNEVLQETLPNIIAAHVMQDYLGGYGAQQNPVGACATAAVSVEQATDLLRLGKADFVVAGAMDDVNAETITGFGDMGATADSRELARCGVEERFYSRPNDRRRAGFVESAGGGTVLLTRGDVAADLGLPVTAVVGYAGSFADGINVSVPAPGRGVLAAATGGQDSPLARGLRALAVSADDIAFVSKHDTSTPANDPHESEMHEHIATALGRAAGNPLAVVSQKSITGHAKGGAAVFQIQGAANILATGVIPPNRSLDCVDPKLRANPRLTWLRRPLDRQGGTVKCGLVTSLGFGHISALIALVHPGAFRAALARERGAEAAARWARSATDRQRAGAQRYREAMYGGAPLYRRPAGRNLGGEALSEAEVVKRETDMLLDPQARISREDK